MSMSSRPGQPVREGWLTPEWSRFALRLLVNGISHPIEHAKVLIQLGHEPLASYDSYTLLGAPARALPNVFQYVAYLQHKQGLSECYRGVTPKLTSNIISAVVFTRISKQLNEDVDIKDTTEEERRRTYARRLACEAAARVAAVVVSHPLHVIAVRSMAQTVGGETKYSGLWAPVALYNDSGFLGYFQGLVPRVMGELLTLGISTLLTFAVHYYVVDDRDVRFYLAAALSYVASAITYPFQVVCTCMAASGSGLLAVKPPNMPEYHHWWNCWMDLWSSGQLGRGSGLFWRYAHPTTAAALMPQLAPPPPARRKFSFFRRKSEREEL